MKFNKILQEKFLDAENYKPKYGNSRYVEIFENPEPKEYKELLKDSDITIVRAVLTKDADLYIISSTNVIHDDLLKLLDKRGILTFHQDWYENTKVLKEYICLFGERNRKLQPADSYNQEVYDEIGHFYISHYEKILNKNNPSFSLKYKG